MIAGDNTIQAEGFGDFFRNRGKEGLIASKKMATNVLKNPARALEIGANVDTAFASSSSEETLSSLPEVINFYYTGKTLYLGKFV